MTYMMLEGVRRRSDLEPLEAKQKDDRRRKDATKGSALLRDAILISKGLMPPSIKREPRPFPKKEVPVGCLPACPLCQAPLKPDLQLISDIQQTVSSYFGIDHKSMVAASRRITFSHPRQLAMYLAVELTHKPYSEIGRRFGGKDHTTVIHAWKVVGERIRNDPEWAMDAEVLRDELTV